ncbi:reverse transcriptase domain-containing protein [Tanacetum coccineum]
MVPDESDKVEKYVRGLPDSIQGNVMSAKPKMLQEAIELANSLMDQKVCAYAARQADFKRSMDNNSKDNHVQQPPYKRQNVAKAYTVGPIERINMLELYLCATSAICILMGCALTITCFECGNQGHYRSKCPRLKNQNYGNQTGNGEARGRLYALGGGEADQDPNDFTDDIDA